MNEAQMIRGPIPHHLYDAALTAAEPGVNASWTVIRHDDPEQNEMLELFEFEHDGVTYAAWMLWTSVAGVGEIFGDDAAVQLKAEARARMAGQ